jgi:chemotaxis signal transduction protein
MKGMSLEPSDGMDHREADATATITLLECGIGGCRFGVATSHVIETEEWTPDFLTPLPSAPAGIVGTIFFDGHTIVVLDLRRLFWLDDKWPESDASMVMVVQYGPTPFAILVDGLIGIHDVPRDAIRSFTSLYVWGVKWLRGSVILADRVISILDLKMLDQLRVWRP